MSHSLLSAAAVRRSADHLFALAGAGSLTHWRIDPEALPRAVDTVATTIRSAYPDLAIPYHARWRHFAVGGRDRWAQLSADLSAAERLEAAVEAVIVSVLLDAGAGTTWHVAEDGRRYHRSEGLAVASLAAYGAGVFSAGPSPRRVDAAALQRLDESALAPAFQVSAANPLPGMAGRVALLQRLGAVVAARTDVFPTGRLGAFAHSLAHRPAVAAEDILAAVLEVFGPVWPGGRQVAGVDLGDAWPHDQALEAGHVPFHKLSQWLSYSLLEPLEAAGITVTGLDGLTGLPEYRNGGLMIDTGLIVPHDPGLLTTPLSVGHPAVVEWRALTVAWLDRLRAPVARALTLDPDQFPLARLLEGGTWAAGRAIAARLRADGGPPLQLLLDGTVF
ncbi:MAG: DUF1688 family protein [Alphaproteobacteria bacterium]|nr:DUF1688 family protein [Alphaproteobacteria bacterium]